MRSSARALGFLDSSKVIVIGVGVSSKHIHEYLLSLARGFSGHQSEHHGGANNHSCIWVGIDLIGSHETFGP